MSILDDQNGSSSGRTRRIVSAVNLAAKLFARYPKLTTASLRKLIVDGADKKTLSGRSILLTNPKRSFAPAASRGAK